MKIFIAGPEGAGKTVFAAMLNEYISSGRNDLSSQAADIGTKKYFSLIHNRMLDGKWPDSNAPGQLVSLKSHWQSNGRTLNIELIDPAGEDIRSGLRDENGSPGTVNALKSADIVVLLVDLYGHQSDPVEKRIENAGIIEQTLRTLGPAQKLIFAVSKADLLKGTISRDLWDKDAGVLELVERMMPELNLDSLKQVLRNTSTCMLAFSAVSSTCNREEEGLLVRFPGAPLEPDGLAPVVDRLLEYCKAVVHERKRLIKQKQKQRSKRITGIAAVAVISLAILLLALTLMLKGCSGNGSCPNCGGDGTIGDDGFWCWLIPNAPCPRCKGTGRD